MAKQFLDAAGLNQYTQALKNGNLKVKDASNALYAATAEATGLIGKVPLANLPEGALEKLVQVANKAARLALTASQVQLGDTVQELDTKLMYIVVDEDKLSPGAGTPGSEDAFVEYTAGRATFAQDASHADEATHATTADDASTAKEADHATTADDASTAQVAYEVSWNNVTSKPEEFKPVAHTHGAADVSTLTGYQKAQTAADVAAADSLLTALGKIEKKADDAAAAAAAHTQDASTINMTGYTVASSYTAVTSSDTALTAIEKVEKKALDSSNTADWGSITNKPTEYTPALHTQDASTIIALTGYTKASALAAIVATDSLEVALGKLEYRAEQGADEPIPTATIDSIINGTFGQPQGA